MSLMIDTLFFSLVTNLAKTVDGVIYGGTLNFNYAEKPSDASIIFHNTYTIAASTDLDIDLAGTLTSGEGSSATFSKIYGIVLRNLETTTGKKVTLGGGGNFHAWAGAQSHEINTGPNGLITILNPTDGYTVTATTADILRIRNTGLSSIQVRLALIGK